jgi:ABC-type multidrug transport system fused ATPase/permease subunit
MTLRTWAQFARFFSDSKRLLFQSLVLSIAQAALLVPIPLLVKELFDTKLPDGDTAAVIWSGLAILALYLGSASLGLWSRYSTVKSTKSAVTRMRFDLLERIYELPRAYFDRRSLGELHSTIVQDSERVDVMSYMLVAQLLPALVVSLALCVVLAFLNLMLLAAFAAVVPVVILLGRWLGVKVREATRAWQRAFDTFSSQTQLVLRAITLTKVRGAADTELEQRRMEVAELSAAGQELTWIRGGWEIVQGAVAAAAGVVVLMVGGAAVASGSMSIGELLSFYVVVALLLRQVAMGLKAAPMAVSGYESFVRLDAITESSEPEPYTGIRRLHFTGALAAESVSFDYGRKPLLDHVSMDVESGEFVALVGPNGAGKTTLLSLILGLYRPREGSLLADGVPYEELDIVELRRQMGVILQDPIVFPSTIRQNIAYGRPAATAEEVREAARWATAADWIESLPDGYETQMGDEGGLMSGGERQRVALARALLSRPALLVMDEPTIHLDDATIRRLLQNLAALPGRPAVLAISHDPVVAEQADRVFMLRDGRVVVHPQAGSAAAAIPAMGPTQR